MNAPPDKQSLGEQVGAKATRKLRARHISAQGVWSGVSFMGIIGWSVCVPTLLGVSLGLWLDKRHPRGAHSWTLALLAAGLSLGCLIAWQWVAREHETMRREQEDHDE